MRDLQAEFGQIDIYLFDQLLRGRITPGMRILDAGCGGGRNIVYLLNQGYEVFGADEEDCRGCGAIIKFGYGLPRHRSDGAGRRTRGADVNAGQASRTGDETA